MINFLNPSVIIKNSNMTTNVYQKAVYWRFRYRLRAGDKGRSRPTRGA